MEIKDNQLKDFWNNKKVEEKEDHKEYDKKEKYININMNRESKKEKVIPIFFFIQLALNTFFFFMTLIGNELFMFLMILNFVAFFLLSIIEYLNDEFKKENDKYIWLGLFIFMPYISVFLYQDFRKSITIN